MQMCTVHTASAPNDCMNRSHPAVLSIKTGNLREGGWGGGGGGGGGREFAYIRRLLNRSKKWREIGWIPTRPENHPHQHRNCWKDVGVFPLRWYHWNHCHCCPDLQTSPLWLFFPRYQPCFSFQGLSSAHSISHIILNTICLKLSLLRRNFLLLCQLTP